MELGSVRLLLQRLGANDMVLVCKNLCSGETTCKGLLWPAEDEIQHKGKDGKHKSDIACKKGSGRRFGSMRRTYLITLRSTQLSTLPQDY